MPTSPTLQLRQQTAAATNSSDNDDDDDDDDDPCDKRHCERHPRTIPIRHRIPIGEQFTRA